MNSDWRVILADKIKGLAELIDALGEPIFSFIAVTVPFVAPFVIAQITATALVAGQILTLTQANWLAGVLEGIGIVGLSGLVLAIEKTIRSKNPKWDSMIYLLGTIDILYFLFLVSVNVLLDRANGVNGIHIFIKALICLVPLMTGGIYGYYRIINREKIEKIDAKKTEYEIRQEQREDRLKSKALKAGINIFAPVALNQDTPQVKLPSKGDWRNLTPEERHEVIHVLTVTDITNKYGVSRSTAFAWKKNSD